MRCRVGRAKHEPLSGLGTDHWGLREYDSREGSLS